MHFVQSAVLRSHVVCLSVCLSVRLSVTLVDCDHIQCRLNSFEIISPLVTWDVRSLQTQTSRVYSKANTRKFWPNWVICWFERRRYSIANCGRMVTDSATVTMESLHHRSFEWCHRWPPRPSFLKNGGSICPQDTQMAISPPQWSDTLYVWF